MKLIDELEKDILNMENAIKNMPEVVCTHIICDACKSQIEEQKKLTETLIIQLTEKKQLLDKLKSYGIDK